MAIQRAIPLEPVRPNYQSPDGYRRDIWRRWLRFAAALLAGVLLVATAMGARAGIRRWPGAPRAGPRRLGRAPGAAGRRGAVHEPRRAA